MGNTTLMDYLNDIARAVQSKTGKTKKIKLKDLAEEIDGIDALNTHKFANDATHPLTINSNGNYNIYDNDFSHIVVDIPFAGDDLAPYFQNQTGSGPYTMVYYNHMLPSMQPGGVMEEAGPESEEVSEVGYSSYDFNIGDGGVAFLTYAYNSSSHVYADHSVSFYKHNLDSSEIIARENYHLTNPDDEWNDNKCCDITIVDLYTGYGTYPVVYYNSSGYLAKDDNVATPGYVSWRNNSYDSFYSTNLSNGEIVYKQYDEIRTTVLSSNDSHTSLIYRNGTGSDADIEHCYLYKGYILYNNNGEIDTETRNKWAAYRDGDYVNTTNSTSDIIYYNSSTNKYSALDIDGCVVYPGANGVVAEDIHEGAGLYASDFSTSGFKIYRQELSDANNSARILIGAGYGSNTYETYKCLPSNVISFTVSSGQTYINEIDLNASQTGKVCKIVLPKCKDFNYGYAYNITYPSDFTRSNSFDGLTPNQSISELSYYYTSVELLNNTKIAYLDEYNSSGHRVYGDITQLYPANQYNTDALDVTTPTKTNLSAMYVAYYSPRKGFVDFGQIYGDDGNNNNVLKAYHLGTENGKYCVVSTNLSYSFSDNNNGYTNNFITVLYPHIADYSNDSTKEKASIGNLTVTPNRYYKLNYGNYLDSIGLENISPIKLGQTNPTYYWSAPVEGEAPSTPQVHTEVFGYIRIYQDPNGHSIDVPVTYEMITAIVNAGISIDTDYVEPVE